MTPATTIQHRFDQAIKLTTLGEGRSAGLTSAAYANMVGPFGGITAATLLRAVQQDPRCLGEPLSITVNFTGPTADGSIDVSANPVRTNRSTQHWTVTMSQDGAVTTTATAVFGTRRSTWSTTETAPPSVPPANSVPVTVFPDLVAWTGNYEMRFVEGSGLDQIPDDGRTSTSTLWVRDHPPRPLDYTSLTALSDVFLPRVMVRLGRFVPAGTVSLTVYFHADHDLLAAQADQPVLATARAHHFGNGFFDQSAELWSSDGRPLTTTHQLVYFKD